MPIAEGIELVGYIFGFWLFIFSRRFRESWISEFSRGNSKFRFFAILEVACAIFCGLIGPLWLALYLISNIGVVT